MDELLETIEWKSSVNIESYQTSCIANINGITGMSEDQIYAYLSNLMHEISELGAVAEAQTLAKEISDADGEIADDEVKYLDLVMSYKLPCKKSIGPCSLKCDFQISAKLYQQSHARRILQVGFQPDTPRGWLHHIHHSSCCFSWPGLPPAGQ